MKMTGFEDLFSEEKGFFQSELKVCEVGHLEMEIRVNKVNANPYGMAHGGYLFSICDNVAGIVGYTLGSYVVSQQASISYLSPAKIDEVLSVCGRCIHDGGRSKVVETEIRNEKQKLVCKGTFTLFPVKKVEDDV